MTTETESKKGYETLIPRIEKPSIQIVMGHRMDRKLDYHVAAIALNSITSLNTILTLPTQNLYF